MAALRVRHLARCLAEDFRAAISLSLNTISNNNILLKVLKVRNYY